ncbi:MAG: ATP-binding protein [Spirochaetota bacterium]
MKEDPKEDILDPGVKHDLERGAVERRAQLESFAYLAAHSLKAPLRAIAGFSKALLEDYQAILDDEGRRLLGLVVENAGTMQRLIADLLKLSRVERLQIESSRIDMKSMAIAMFYEAANPEERAALSFAVDDLPEAEGDSILIRLAWRELLENAVKFTRSAKRREIRVSSETREAETRYSVSDTGTGFDMAYVGKLFQVFQRLHSSKEFEGSGVGLVIVKSIIERHGGRVGAEGRKGEGATFWFTLPHAAATAATAATATTAATAARAEGGSA